MIHGSCLCGRVKYRINGALSRALNCHCSMCRKAQGAAFRSRASVKALEFEWLQGLISKPSSARRASWRLMRLRAATSAHG
uniref:GFA family protein n=2 Tax=Bradyrhizobium oligotrophicum TaxID=44255 RepID=UPI002699C063